MGNVDVGAAIGASFRYIGEAWSKAWGIMLILVWFTGTLQAIELLKPDWGFATFLGAIATLFLTVAATGALYRLSLTGDHPGDRAFAPGPAGLQWGGLEWRVMGANLIVGIGLGVLFVVLFLIWAVMVGVVVGLSGSPEIQALESGSQAEKTAALGRVMLGPAGLVSAIIGIPSVLGLLYLGARLALVAPVAADTRAFDFSKAWTLTRGAVLALILGSIVIFLLELVIGAVLGGVAGLAAALTGNAGSGRVWGGIAGQTVSAAINAPLFAGLVLYVYRRQRGDTAVAAMISW